MQKDYKKILQNTGLDKKAAIVYLAALRNGQSTLSELSRITNIGKTTLYPHIAELVQRGFVTKVPHGKRMQYAAEKPERISRALEVSKNDLESILPDLTQLHGAAFHTPQVTTYTGKEEILRLYDHIIENAHYLKTIWSPQSYYNVMTARHDDEFVQKLSARDVTLQTLLVQGQDSAHYLKTPNARLQKIRTLPKEHKVHINVLIFAEHVALISFQNLFGILIKNSEISRYHESVFDQLWKGGE